MASETTTISSSKRRKTDQGVVTCLSDIPIGILEHTASFLAAPSRALFAVALTTIENNPPGENYSSIAGSDWDTLDFGEIEKDLAVRLSDNNISDVLQLIDAVNNVKRLRLTHCTNITGAGLRPLHGSINIEQIDLSLVGVGENPRFVIDPPISCEAVLPILDSIIAVEGCAPKHLQFPYWWRKTGRSTDSEFHAFIDRYNEMWENGDTITCLNCNQDLTQNGDKWIGPNGGLHNYTCCQCLKHYYYCDDCLDNDGDDFSILQYCDRCQRDYCKECVKFNYCDPCDRDVCGYCSKVECNECDKTICVGCVYGCSYCDVAYCSSCSKMYFCEQCSERCCNSCRLRLYQEEGSEKCNKCIKLLPHEVVLVDQSRRLQQEVEQLKNEVRGLKGVNKELQEENKELNDKIKSMAEYGVMK